MFDRLTRGLIPCGGRGTRMSSVTHGMPKELLRIGGVPLVEHVVRECCASGITDLLIVVAPGKSAIAHHLEPLAGTEGIPPRISFIVQEDAVGLAHAIGLGRDFAGEGALAVALPDNLFIGTPPALSQVMEVARATGKSTVAMSGIAAIEASRRGATAVYEGELSGTEFRIARIPHKRARDATFDTAGAAVAYTGVGRYVFGSALWPAIDHVARTLAPTEELDDVPVMQLLLHRELLTGCLLRTRFLDVGLPAGYDEARALLG
jgi:UTP-glucose-1-phosphate uridylyltransferase